MNDSLYNPDSMSKEDIKTLFVARQSLLDELVTTIKTQPKGAGVQHLLIISPRGMGKTTMLLMTQFAVEDNQDLAKNWQAVRFPEESYDITDLADFWLKVLDYLDDKSLKPKIEEIKNKYRNSEDLREAAWALIKDWSKQNKKRIVLLVDNFDMILDQIGSDNEQARLRDILMNDGTIMLIGCSPSYFHQIQDYGQPLYNFFKVFNLSDLKFPDIEELIRRRAEIDEVESIEELLQKNRTRIKALETFTGGNPRLLLMLYRIITSSDITEIRNGLEKLLDAVTPFYKDKTEKLPPQQRKIFNEIAQYSLETNEGVSPTEIAKRMRTTPNQVSSQLKRMSENGYVKALNIRGRTAYYVISETLYVIWSQRRFGRTAREKMNFLVLLLKKLYEPNEMPIESEKLVLRFNDFFSKGNIRRAKDVLEHHSFLIDAMENKTVRAKSIHAVVCGYLDLKDSEGLQKEFLSNVNLKDISLDTLKIIAKTTSLPKNDVERAMVEKVLEEFHKGFDDLQFDNVVKTATALIENFPDGVGFVLRHMALTNMGKYEEALKDLNEYSKRNPTDATIYKYQGGLLAQLGNYKEAVKSFQKAVSQNDMSEEAWQSFANALFHEELFEEADRVCDKILQNIARDIEVLIIKAVSLRELGRFEESIDYHKKVLKQDRTAESYYNYAVTLGLAGKEKEALTAIQKSLNLKPKDKSSLFFKTILLNDLGRFSEMLESLEVLLDLNPQNASAWELKANALEKLNKSEEALLSYNNAIKFGLDYDELRLNKGLLLNSTGNYQEAIKDLEKATKGNLDNSWFIATVAYINLFLMQLRRNDDKSSIKKAWRDLIEQNKIAEKNIEKEKVNSLLIDVIWKSVLISIELGNFNNLSEILNESEYKDRLFYFYRAFEYLKTNDDLLIESLSPEAKDAVLKILQKIENLKKK